MIRIVMIMIMIIVTNNMIIAILMIKVRVRNRPDQILVAGSHIYNDRVFQGVLQGEDCIDTI